LRSARSRHHVGGAGARPNQYTLDGVEAGLDPALSRRAARFTHQRPLVLSLYREVRPLPDGTEGLLRPLQALRGLYFDAWFVSRWAEPGFSAHYPDDDVTDPAWWARNIASLERLLRAAS